MSTPEVRRRDDLVKPHYVLKPSDVEGPARASSDETRRGGEVSGVVARFAKTTPASQVSTAYGYIKARYADAVEYMGIPQGLRGVLLLWGLVGAFMGCITAFFGSMMFESSIVSSRLLGLGLVVVGVAFAFRMLFYTTRLELFRPEDEPTIFDRQHRKVYRVFRETHPGWRGLLKRWPLRATEYDWDLIDAEHQVVLTTTGSTVTRYHSLVFIVKKSATDATIIDSFTIGHTLELGEQTVPALWEHIRLFMEEGGPHLPPGESLAPARPPQGLWQSLQAVGPVGSSYRRWWSDNAGFMILIHLLFPVFVPLFLLWGVFNWLSYRTATRIEWPSEVKAAVGSAS